MATRVQPAVLKEKLSEQELCPPDLLKGQEEAFARDIERMKARRSEFVAVSCPACGAKESTYRLEKFTFTFVTCNGCKTIYMNPRPSPAVMQAYYSNSENYQYWAKHIFPASEASRREKLHKPWLERVAGFCDKYGIPRGVLVEVGAGFGTFSEVAKQSDKFKDVIAIEPTPQMAASCRKRGLKVVEKRIEDVQAEVGQADVVVAFELIEHLFHPRDLVQQCRRILRPGGLLVLSCPNGQGFDIALLGAGSMAVDAEHVNLFNPESLSLLVESCGFDVLDISTPGRLDTELAHDAILAGRYEAPDSFLQRVLVDEWDRLGWPFQRFLAENGLSSHMWMAARKR